MQIKKTAIAASALLFSSVMAEYSPDQPWDTLTPTGTFPGLKSYETPFGIAVVQVTNEPKRRDLAPISQIGDGQIQATYTPIKTYVPPLEEICAPGPTAAPVSQISDGQPQAPTQPVMDPISQIGDGQIQAPSNRSTVSFVPKPSGAPIENDPITARACAEKGTLQITLKDGVLRDSHGRIGSIVSNRQFQFDGPPPQAGTIYAGGWTLTDKGYLALGDSDVFYQCLSGNFYNLYDQNIAPQCSPIHLQALHLVDC